MTILVYGAGNIGCLYAALLAESGQDVSILARGKRLAALREHGVQLENAATREQTTVFVQTVERLGAEDAYDLVVVALPKNHVREVLPVLAANAKSPSVLFFGNNAAGPKPMTDALGGDRVLLGFPGAAAVAHDHRLHYRILSRSEQPTTIGELDGTKTPRIEAIARVFGAAGLPTSIDSNTDAWLKTHAVEISPTANALDMAGADPDRLARTRDALVLMLRAIREGYRVLSALRIPIRPKNHRTFQWLPEPLLLALMRRAIRSEATRVKVGHALGARSEMKTLADELGQLIRQAQVPTPSIEILNRHLDPETEPIADGSSEIPVQWTAVWFVMVGLLALASLWILVR